PARAEVPPRSLHDALPIYAFRVTTRRRARGVVGGPGPRVHGAIAASRIRRERARGAPASSGQGAAPSHLARELARGPLTALRRADRKSTRLNSSHVKISYA